MSQLHLTLSLLFSISTSPTGKKGYFSPRSEKKCTMFAKTSQKVVIFHRNLEKNDTFLGKNRQDLEKSGQFSPKF